MRRSGRTLFSRQPHVNPWRLRLFILGFTTLAPIISWWRKVQPQTSDWLVFLTTLENISQWEGLSRILWKKKCLKSPTRLTMFSSFLGWYEEKGSWRLVLPIKWNATSSRDNDKSTAQILGPNLGEMLHQRSLRGCSKQNLHIVIVWSSS